MTSRSTNLNLRISPNIREALKLAAQRDHRSVSNMVEYMIVQYCETNGIQIPKAEVQEDVQAESN